MAVWNTRKAKAYGDLCERESRECLEPFSIGVFSKFAQLVLVQVELGPAKPFMDFYKVKCCSNDGPNLTVVSTHPLLRR